MTESSFICDTLESLKLFAEQMALHPSIENANIQLMGELGAGKSTFTRYLLQSLGVTGTIKSPTYAVVEEYWVKKRQGELGIWHFDFYRFNDPSEWEEAGFRDIFMSTGLKISEWPQKASGFIPDPDLVIDFEFTENEDSRIIKLKALTQIGHKLLEK